MPWSRSEKRQSWSNGDGCIPGWQRGYWDSNRTASSGRKWLKPQLQYSNKSFDEIEEEMAAVVAAYEGR